MKRVVICILSICAGMMAQAPVQTVAISGGSPNAAFTTLLFYTGSNLTFLCKSPAQPVPAYSWSVTAQAGLGTLTNVSVSSLTATATTVGDHGLQPGAVITVSGSTTSALNATAVIATVPSSTTFTFVTTAGDATYATANLKVSSTAPRSNASIWSIERFCYDGSATSCSATGTNLTAIQWAAKTSSGMAGSTAYSFSCDAKSTLAYQ